MSDILVMEDWSSPRWRIEHLYWVLDDQGNEVKFVLREEQREYLDNLWSRNVICKARQLGMSTLVSVLQLDQCVWNANFRAATICDTLDNARKMFRDKILFPWERLPQPIQDAVGIKRQAADQIEFGNGSVLSVTTSARSGTLQSLHVSEWGKICAKYPEKAKEIKSGSIPAVVQDGGVIHIESTAEGQEGDFYEMVTAAKQRQDQKKPLTILDFRLHFFPWYLKPTNTLDPVGVVIPKNMLEYFATLKAKFQIELSPGQMAWYVKTAETLGNLMKRENPSVISEAFEASVEGAIFQNEMTILRKRGSIGAFKWNPKFPVNTFWDFGVSRSSGSTAVWFHQRIDGMNRLIDFMNETDQGIGWWVNQLRSKPYTYQLHYMPHDVRTRMQGEQVVTREQLFNDKAIYNIRTVPRVSEIGKGIEMLRSFLLTCEFDEKGCSEGIKGIDSYRREWDEKAGRWSERPLHNYASDVCDSLRQAAQGYSPDAENWTHQMVSIPAVEILDAEVGY